MRRSAEKICWEDLLRKSAEKICWENLLRRSAEKICWEDLLKKICWEDLLRRSAEKSAEKICWENLLRRSAEKICWEDLLKKICWEDLLRRSAEKICWEDLLRMVVDQDFLKISFFFYAGWVWSIKTGDHPLVTSCSSDVQNWGEMRILKLAVATLSSLRAHRTSKTEVKCECWSSPSQPSRHFVLIGRPKLRWNANVEARRRNPLVVSCSSDVQNWGEMRILKLAVATLSSFRAHRTSKTEVKCESAWVVWQPSRRFVLIGRPKLWWNANLWLRRWTLSSLRAGQMSETVVKWWFLYAACCPGLPALDSYIFAYAAVVKRGFWNVEWHAVVARRTSCFCWMNPLVGFGGSMARNCGETQIFYGNCRKHRAKRSFWKLCCRKFEGSLARNVRFGSFVLWNLEEASHETLVLEACSVKFRRSIARNDYFGNFFCENCRKHRAKRSFWKLVLWKLEEASHETIFLAACSVKFRGSIARNDRFGSFFCENCRKHRAKRSFWKLLFCEISRKHRTKRSFWKLFLWKLSEASRETLVLEACSVKFRGSLARNDRFRVWNLVLVAAFSY